MGLRASWSSIIQAGITKETPFADARRVVMLNAVAVLVFALSAVGLCVPTTFAEPVFVAVTAGMLLVSAAVLWLHRRGAYNLAAVVFLAAALGTILVEVVVVSAHAGHVNFLLPLAVLPWLVASSRSLVLALTLSLAAAVSFAVVIYTYDVGYDLEVSARYIGGFAVYNLAVTALLITVVGYFSRSIAVAAELGLERERRQSERLVFEVLPPSIAERVSRGEAQIAERIGDASVLFCSIVEFSRVSAGMDAEELVRLLDDLFGTFDELCERHGVEKIKSSGDQYMAAAGVPLARTDHAEAVAALALDMQRAAIGRCSSAGAAIHLRIGINSGPVVAGVLGRTRLSYDLWGDTVNTAQRMEVHAHAGEVQISPITYAKINHRFVCVSRAPIEIKGKDPMRTYLIKGVRPGAGAAS